MIKGADTNSHSIVDRLKSERDRFVAFAFASADILMELDKEGSVKFADGAINKLLSLQPEELVGKAFLDIIHEDDKDLAEYFLSPESSSRIDNVSVRLKTKLGTSFPLMMSGFRISELQGHFYLTFSTFRSDLDLSDISRRDLDSGLLRRSEFSLAVNKQLIMSKFSANKPQMTMINIDADLANEFKGALRDISDLVRSVSMANDTAGLINDNMLGLVHDEGIRVDDLVEKIKFIIARAGSGSNPVAIKNVTINLEAEIDISEEDSAQAIVYTINKFANSSDEEFNLTSLSDSYDEMVGEVVEKIAEFRQTVEDELFDLAFQPIVEIETGHVSHFEVLTRLRDLSKFNNPFQFIEFGENVGMISEFDFKMVCRALDLLKEMDEQGCNPKLAVNLSGYSLSSQLFLDKLHAILSKNRKYGEQLIFEITESAKVKDVSAVNEYFKKLRRMGVKCSIDDFGTGEATFEYLRNFQVDIVKIDGSYLSEEALESENNKSLLAALGNLCKDMGVDVIGERVEDIRGEKMLADAGIGFAQGYYYSKPSTDSEILKVEEIIKDTASVSNIADFRKDKDVS